MKNTYLISAIKQFEYYKLLGDKTLVVLPEESLFLTLEKESNSIAHIVKHLTGNMLSRWTDFLTTDGEKEWRDRDAEFVMTFSTKQEIIEYWNKGWSCLLKTLESLTNEDLEKIVYIRNQGHTVVEAINRQLAHYPYHVGQMVYIGKMISGKDWESLSISKDASKEYNSEKFSKEKNNVHFTDEYLK